MLNRKHYTMIVSNSDILAILVSIAAFEIKRLSDQIKNTKTKLAACC